MLFLEVTLLSKPKPTMSEKDKKEAETDDITQVDQEIVYRHMPSVLYIDKGIEKTEKKEEKNKP